MSYADDTEDWDHYLNSQGSPTSKQLRDWVSEADISYDERVCGQIEVGAAAALKVILKTGRRSRFRELAIVCRRNHAIAEVYRTAKGLVLCGVGPVSSIAEHDAGGVIDSHYHPDYGHVGDTEWSATWRHTRRANRAEEVALFVDHLREEEKAWQIATLQCRCQTIEVSAAQIRSYLASGKRRVVHEGRAQRT